ncbi:polysaccharide deacetylase family protein [Oscillatoria amoena NRMC-F 0135]|nr:polysaccharide deacetylase family protein [Oscillatoria amoena NRMC-F 0135]
MTGVLTISLDFELHWGGFEKWPLTVSGHQSPVAGNRKRATGNYEQYFLNTRRIIPQMLDLFSGYKVHVTWAGVGMLMHENRETLMMNFPEVRPSYVNKELSAYQFIEEAGIGENENDDPFHYAHSLVKQIVSTPCQELGSHTFSHFYCNEEGQTVEQFRADLKSAQKAASVYGVQLRSLVFPRNQFNDACLRVCFEEGLTSVRSNPNIWFWDIRTRSESRWKRFNRGLDAYFPINGKYSYPLSSVRRREGFPICLPASRLLRPYNPKELFLNTLKIRRIKAEIEWAARHGEVYHLWWHPHNFGNYPEANMDGLMAILEFYQYLRQTHGMRSLSMNELAGEIAHSY